jgi:hypothetical protein
MTRILTLQRPRARVLAVALVATAAAALAMTAVALAATSTRAVIPSNSTPPSVTGSTSVGDDLTANPGTWNGSAPISFQFQWLSCDPAGANCKAINGATKKTYTLQSGDVGTTVRIRVIAANHDGSTTEQSDQTAKITAATTTTTTTTPSPGPSGCPSQTTGVVPVTDISGAASLLISNFKTNPSTILGSTQSFTLQVRVGSTCGPFVSGAIVYATAVPYNQFSVPDEAKTDSTGNVTLTFNRLSGFPAARNQGLLVFFIRARKDGEDILAGISNRRLVSVPVHLNG